MDYKLLENAPLFKDVPPEEINVMLQCLGTEERDYDKGETIFHAGDVIHNIGLVLTGRVQIENDDVWGNKSVMESVGPGFAFAESYACIPNQPILVDVKTCEATEILFINVPALFVESNSCGHGAKLIQNLLRVSSRKNINLFYENFSFCIKDNQGKTYFLFFGTGFSAGDEQYKNTS